MRQYGHNIIVKKAGEISIRLLLCMLIVTVTSISSSAQDYKAKESLRKGNSHYEAGEYDKALEAYQLANGYDSTYAKAAFNQANILFHEGRVDEAKKLYEEASNLFTDKKDKSKAHHNIGRSHLQSALGKLQAIAANGGQPQDESQDPRSDLEASLTEFKESLMLDPADEEARYNYGYAQKLLSQLPPSQGQQQPEDGEEGEDQEQEKEQNEQDKESDEESDVEEQNDESDSEEKQDKGEEEKNDEKEEEPTPQQQDPNRMSAEQQLDLLDQEEKELQKQMSKKRLKGSPIRVEKDW